MWMIYSIWIYLPPSSSTIPVPAADMTLWSLDLQYRQIWMDLLWLNNGIEIYDHRKKKGTLLDDRRKMTCNYVDFAFVRLRTKTGLGDLKFRTYKHLTQVKLTRFPLYAGCMNGILVARMILFTRKEPNTTPKWPPTLHPVASFYLVRGRVPLLHSVSNIKCSVADKPV